ncbi:hypothetical protein Plim_1020 [Planctopirus limnophila DSM 3776]|uniref:Uncharacterized protein n=1 Tax=Planctopirus limnophila (strain ATCC 43296 / DSM 3776 / IFAM 1008 / Mu 290) TaxID=521674 RepID=D5ST95_PLAL2|nr:hypothetical protein Plim_1020 [Planctopirus limnophila DSM 3776]
MEAAFMIRTADPKVLHSGSLNRCVGMYLATEDVAGGGARKMVRTADPTMLKPFPSERRRPLVLEKLICSDLTF